MKGWAEGKNKAYIYTRYGNPTLTIAEEKIAALEGAEAAVVTASGMAAISSALLAVLRSGDEVIASHQVYGGSYRLFRDIFPRFGISVRHVESDLEGIEKLVGPANEGAVRGDAHESELRLVDLQKAVAFARKHGLVSIVDNTFASPALQKPIEMGFDIVVHSATKYLGGHSDIIAGAAAGSRKWMESVRSNVIYLGGSMDPGAAFLLIRGMKTLGVRIATAMRDGHGGGEVPGQASESGAGALSRAAFAPGSFAGQEADARIWGHDVVRYEGRGEGGAAVLRPGEDLFDGGELGRGGIAGGAADLYLALQHVTRGIEDRGSGARAR